MLVTSALLHSQQSTLHAHGAHALTALCISEYSTSTERLNTCNDTCWTSTLLLLLLSCCCSAAAIAICASRVPVEMRPPPEPLEYKKNHTLDIIMPWHTWYLSHVPYLYVL